MLLTAFHNDSARGNHSLHTNYSILPFIREEQWVNRFKSRWKRRVALSICYKYSDVAMCYKVRVCPRGHMEETYFHIPVFPQATSSPGEFLKFANSIFSYVWPLSRF